MNKAREELVALGLEMYRDYCTNITDGIIVAKFVNTPYDSALSNIGLVGGNLQLIRVGDDDFWVNRPLPELSRYRTPIEDLDLKPGSW